MQLEQTTDIVANTHVDIGEIFAIDAEFACIGAGFNLDRLRGQATGLACVRQARDDILVDARAVDHNRHTGFRDDIGPLVLRVDLAASEKSRGYVRLKVALSCNN